MASSGGQFELEHSLGDLLTAHEQSDQGRIRRGRIRDALDDELHLLAGSLQARVNENRASLKVTRKRRIS